MARGTPPADWGDPEQALNRSQFFDIMDFCLEKLPPNTRPRVHDARGHGARKR